MYFNESFDIFNVFKLFTKRGHIFGSLLKLFKATCRVKPSCFAAVFLEFSPIFHEKFHAATDYDLLLQCVYKYKVDYVPEVLSKWRDHISSGTSVARVEVPTDNLILLEDLKIFRNKDKIRWRNKIFIMKQHYLFAHALEAGIEKDSQHSSHILLIQSVLSLLLD